jgi:hypothetical protein
MKQTEIALNRAKRLVKEIRQDLGKGYIDVAKLNLQYLEEDLLSIREQIAYDCQGSYEQGEAAGRSQMRSAYDGACERSYNMGYAQASGEAADDLSATLYDICSPGEGNLTP